LSKRIVVLSEEIANKIAAGEVVDRPASIVKELTENSIDAGANDIIVELRKGGCESIKIIDNGEGIASEDVALVFQRHATSKIHKFEDIYNVTSFGFRGEAMPSIASIARVDLLTRRQDDLAGTKAILQAGIVSEIVSAGCPVGTQIQVTEIFANVPARRKFLKAEATEQGLCLDAITRLALVHPEIRFRVNVNGREVFTAPRAKDVSERVAIVMGEDFTNHRVAINVQNENVSMTGFISRPEFTKSNSKSIYLFVNKRFVRDNSITHAVLSAYRQVIEARRYPAAILFLDLPGDDVDVNVHPAKMEVRFKDSRGIHDLVSKTIAQNLTGTEVAGHNFVYRLTPREKMATSSNFWRPKESLPAQSEGLFSRQNMQRSISDDLLKRSVNDNMSSFANYYDNKAPSENKITFANYRYLGQFADTYLVFAGENGLMLVDQHAAHERIILERLKKTAMQKVISQTLLMPEVVSLSPGQIVLFAENIEFLQDIGIDIEIFGRDSIVVKSFPTMLTQIQANELISDIADQLGDQANMPSLKEKKEKIFAALACRAAIKASHILSDEEVAALCRDLEETPFNRTCPHGRPISISFSKSEIERLFKRK
jgi:DNA mismatch repair protein MutL